MPRPAAETTLGNRWWDPRNCDVERGRAHRQCEDGRPHPSHSHTKLQSLSLRLARPTKTAIFLYKSRNGSAATRSPSTQLNNSRLSSKEEGICAPLVLGSLGPPRSGGWRPVVWSDG